MRKLLLLSFLCLSTVLGFAQTYKVSADDPQQFLTDVHAMLAGTKSEAVAHVGINFATAWNSGKISAAQKTKIMALTQEMLKKRLKARPHFENFFGILSKSINGFQYTGANLDNLLSVAETTMQKHDYKVYERFLSNANQFLNSKALYQNKGNSLYAQGGNFSFEYRDGLAAQPAGSGWDDAPAPAATPAAGKTTEEDDPWAGWNQPKKATAPTKTTKTTKGAKGKTATTPAKKEEPKPAEPVVEDKFDFLEEPLPALTGPVLVLQNTDFFFTSPHDSVLVKGLNGAVSLESGKYAGKGGKLTWNHMGGAVTAEFKNLVFEISKPGFMAENVSLSHPLILENDINGNLEYKLTQPKTNGQKAFPRFISFTNDAKIKHFGADIKYVGGLSMAGQTLMSAALDGSPSTIWVSNGGEKKFRATSRSYVITDSLITAPEASIAITQGADSITHPGLKFSYNKEAKRLMLINPDGLYKLTPYSYSYHQVELTADMAIWHLNQPRIDFSILTAKNQVPAQLNSKEYYTESRFNQIKTIANFHPLYTAVGYGQQKRTRNYYLDDMVRDTKLRKDILHNAFTSLAQGSYLAYNPATGYVQLLDKGLHYVDASRDKKDFDYIHLNALSPAGKNATLDMASGDLILRGVQKFTFTKDSIVTAEPDSQMVRVQKNRGILFNGLVKSSNFTFKGTDFLFDYDGFFIDLAKIESTVLTTKSKEKDGREKTTPYTLVSRGGQGTAKLYLNRPDNKSGRKKNGSYPSLDAISGATVYFNKPEILGGVYDTSVYFSIPPFKIDSLASGKNGVVGFTGTFHSAGIFPPIDTRLSVQPDGALGFKYMSPKSGLATYGDKGTFTDSITMDTKGLRGSGVLSYQTATMRSPAFVFYIDSTVTESGVKGDFKAGSVAQGSYPSGTFKSFRMNWFPYKDTLQIETKGQQLMSMFNDKFTYKGMLGFTPSSLFGDGVIESGDVAIKSPLFSFKKGLIHGNRASMEVSSMDKTKPALTTYDIFLDFYLDEGYATYAPEKKGFASTVFPVAQYKSSLGGGRWDFKEKKLTLASGKEDGNDAYFYSMKPGVDSVRFKASGAVYDLGNFTLVASGVPYVPVGDSYLIPDSNRVYIQKDANLKTFRNAGLAMDSVQQYHKMTLGELHVDNRYGLTGNALYKFTNAAGDSYNIKFKDFAWTQSEKGRKEANPQPHFIARAEVAEKDTMFLLPKVRYYGSVILASNQKNIDFDGYAKLLFSGRDNTDWFPFKKNVSAEDVSLEIKKPTLADGTPLKTGIHINATSGKIYNTFVSKKAFDDDLDVFEAEGILSFDKDNGQYKLGPENRVNGSSYTGNLLFYNDASKEVKYEGMFNLISPVRGFSLTASGSGSARTDSSLYALDTFMAFDFTAPSQAMEIMAGNIVKNVEGAPEGVDLNSPTLPYKLAAFIGDKGVEDFKLKTANAYVPFSKISSKLVHTIVLNDVKLKWSTATNAWHSVGPLSIAGIDKTDVNAKINGYIEIKRAGDGTDIVSMYLEPNPYGWYYFNFSDNSLGMVSSDDAFNSAVSKKSNGGKGGTSYSFYTMEQIDKMEFVNYFRKTYLGKGPLEVAPPPPPAPVYDTFANAEEEENGGKKKKKAKKNKDEEGPAPAGFGSAEEDDKEASKKSKKKKKNKKEEGEAPPDIDPVGN